MNTQRPSYRKFNHERQKIEELEKKNPRFKRVFEEYVTMSDELYNLETSDASGIPDDFINAVKLQTEYLRDEIDDWLLEDESAEE